MRKQITHSKLRHKRKESHVMNVSLMSSINIGDTGTHIHVRKQFSDASEQLHIYDTYIQMPVTN